MKVTNCRVWLLHKMGDYGSVSYWDERYALEDTTYDWYQDFEELKPQLMPLLLNCQNFEILIPGCGNSSMLMKIFAIYSLYFCIALSIGLYDSGYHNITNIDTSSVVIAQMNDRFADREDMECMRYTNTCDYV